jgi:hypothetical protein
MKKKSGNSRQQTRQIAPLVRGPLKTKEKGELAELAFLHKAASPGFGVARPHGDSERYDFILDSGERFWRVQVKSIFGLVEAIYRTRRLHGDKIPYTAEEIDFLVTYIASEKPLVRDPGRLCTSLSHSVLLSPWTRTGQQPPRSVS